MIVCLSQKLCIHFLMLLPGLASKKRNSRSPFDESQTEYVKIHSSVKRPCVLTDRQKEVLARQKAGEHSLPALHPCLFCK